MTSFLQWRKMTWAILLAVVLGTVLVIGSGFSLFILGVSLGALGLLWLLGISRSRSGVRVGDWECGGDASNRPWLRSSP